MQSSGAKGEVVVVPESEIRAARARFRRTHKGGSFPDGGDLLGVGKSWGSGPGSARSSGVRGGEGLGKTEKWGLGFRERHARGFGFG